MKHSHFLAARLLSLSLALLWLPQAHCADKGDLNVHFSGERHTKLPAGYIYTNPEDFPPKLTGEETFKIIEEMASLIQPGKAPTERETELYWKLKHATPSLSLKNLNENGRAQGVGMLAWGMRAVIPKNMSSLDASKDLVYLDEAIIRADLTLSDRLRRGQVHPVTGQWEDAEMRLQGNDGPASSCLGHGTQSQAIAMVAYWILTHPEIHHLKAPLDDRIKFQDSDDVLGTTYKDRAIYYAMRLKRGYDLWIRPINGRTPFYQDGPDGVGMWHVVKEAVLNADPNREFEPSAINRFMYFNAGYVGTARLLMLIDPKKYKPWYDEMRSRVDKTYTYWRKARKHSDDPVGETIYWGYKIEQPRGEDRNHLGMTMNAMMECERYDDFIPESEMALLARSIFYRTYDYENHLFFSRISREPERFKDMSKHFHSPLYGSLIGGHIREDKLYKQWEDENIYLLNKQLTIHRNSANSALPGSQYKAVESRVTKGRVKGTRDQKVYQSALLGLSTYDFKVPKGTYTVTLKFCEPGYEGWTEPNKRVFSIDIAGKTVVEKLDVIERVGTGHALDLTFDNITLRHPGLRIDFKDKLRIRKDRRGNTKHPLFSTVSAICIEGKTHEGKPVSVKVNCGGEAYGDYVFDMARNKIPGLSRLERHFMMAFQLHEARMARFGKKQ